MVISLPLLATISCNNETTNQASKVLTSKKGVFFSTVFFGSGTNINEAKQKIDNKWIFDNKNIIFENYELLTSPESITNVKANISGTTIVLSFAVGDKSFEFAIADFVNSDYQELRLTIKNNTVFDKNLFSGFNKIEDVHEAIKLINKDWLKTYKAVIFNNNHLITDNTSIEIKPNISGTFIIVQAIISGETYNFFISGFTNSIISGNNKETIVKSPLYTDDSFNSTWAHEESYNNEKVKSFIETNKDKIFHNLAKETTISSTESVYKVVEGKIEVKVKLGGKVYNTEGQLVDADSSKEYQVSLIGFKTTDLTTYLSSTELDIKEISELSSKKASEIVNNINSNNEELKNKIKDLIKSPTLGQEIQTTSDIEITTQDSNANDAKGTLDLEVTIKNNKAWEDGVKKDNKKFNLKLTGFKIQAPTTIANFEIKDLKKDTFSKHYATPFGKWESTTAATTTETETDEQANEKLLKTELEKHVKSIFNNEPEDVTIKEVKINKDYTIGSIQNGYDAAHGAVYIVVTLNKYYDENGKLVDISSNSTDENKGKFYFKVTGFKVDKNMTTYLDYGSLYDDPELNAINLRESLVQESASKQTSEETSDKISTIKASQWKEKIDFIKQEIIAKLLLEPLASGSLIKNKVYGDDKWHEVTSAYTATGDENWGIEIDANQEAIFDDAKGTLTLEVTFKNIWWKNGVFIKEHKEVIRFSGFNNWIKDKISLNEVTYNPYLQVVEEVKAEDTKEKIAVISNPEFGDVDFIEYLLQFYITNVDNIDQILTEDYQYPAGGDANLIPIPNPGLEFGTEELKKIVQDVLGASIKFSILKSLGAYPVSRESTQQKSITTGTGLEFLLGMNYSDYLAGLEKFEANNDQTTRDLNTLKNKIKVTNINWNENVGDTFNFTIEIIEDTPTDGAKNQNVQKFNFKLIGFLGANNTKIEPPIEIPPVEAALAVDINSNNDISKKDLFDMKWTTHQYSDSEGIKNPQFYGHYWYSLDIVIKDKVTSTSLIDTTIQGLYDKIKNNKLSDFYLHLDDTDVIAYDIVRDEDKKELTVKFKHEKWSTISDVFEQQKPVVKRKQAEQLQQLYFHLAVSNLGSFDFTKIFVVDSTESGQVAGVTTQIPPEFDAAKFPNLERYSKSIFAAEFVKDNYDQYGSIKLKGYDLPIDIDQYDFWYKDEASQEFKELDKSKANIVEKYETQVKSEKVNVFVEIQFNLDEAEKLSKNTKLYVSLKNDQNNKHLIKI